MASGAYFQISIKHTNSLNNVKFALTWHQNHWLAQLISVGMTPAPNQHLQHMTLKQRRVIRPAFGRLQIFGGCSRPQMKNKRCWRGRKRRIMPPFTCVNRISKLEGCVTHQLLSHNGERVEPREEKSGKEGERVRELSL